jgi:RNA ligase
MFPALRHLDEVRPALAGHDEFRVMDKGTHLTIDYAFQGRDTFRPNPAHGAQAEAFARLRRECRGLKFDREGRLLARPFHKFFNLFETEETQPHALDLREALAVEKLDGSMIHPALLPEDGLVLMTMQWRSPIARQAEAHAFAPGQGYETLCRDLLGQGLLPIFEWCSNQQRIVVDHPEDRLVLLAVRHQAEGHYLPHVQVEALARAHGLPVVQASPLPIDFEAWLAEVRGLPASREGAVLLLPSGERVKVKGEAYTRAHQAAEMLSREAWVLEIILAKGEDDVLPLLPPGPREALRGFAHRLRAGLAATAARLEARAQTLLAEAGGDRKVLAGLVGREPADDRPFLFQAAGAPGSVLDRLQRDAAKKRLTEERIEEIRPWWGGLRWTAP